MANNPMFGNLPQSMINQVQNHQLAIRVNQLKAQAKKNANKKAGAIKDLPKTISIAELKDLDRKSVV